jgi:hypothetical protein
MGARPVEYFIPWAKELFHGARAYGVHPVTLTFAPYSLRLTPHTSVGGTPIVW